MARKLPDYDPEYVPNEHEIALVTALAGGKTLRQLAKSYDISESVMQSEIAGLRKHLDLATNYEVVAAFLRRGWIR